MRWKLAIFNCFAHPAQKEEISQPHQQDNNSFLSPPPQPRERASSDSRQPLRTSTSVQRPSTSGQRPSISGQRPADSSYWSELATNSIPEASGQQSLGRRLKKARIEWPPKQSRYFVPVDVLDQLLTPEAIRQELRKTYTKKTDEQLIFRYEADISNTAKRLYALLLYEDKGQFIGSFLDEGVGDKDLPFERADRDDPSQPYTNKQGFNLCRSGHCQQCIANDHEGCGIKALASWEEFDIDDLCRDQWVFQAPVFQGPGFGSSSTKIPHLELDDSVILPFIYDQEGKSGARGGYSEVWGVRIHRAHQKLYKSSDHRVTEPLLAIKRPFSRDLKDFNKEVNMLRDLSVRNHDHLIKLLATYKFKDNYHLVFPFANTNLRGYWDDTEKPHWNKETYSWFFRQIRGLTSGLNAIHNFEADLDPDSQHSHDGQLLTVAKPEAKYGRHGDIKPENILWSNEFGLGDEWGILQIADMGLGRFHGVDSKSRDNPRTNHGSPTYAPPEIDLEKPVSRAYDIWSLGCVFLEFITWLVEGSAELGAFSSARAQTGVDLINDDLFYTIITSKDGTKTADVRKGVLEWIERLHRHPRCSTMIRDLLRIVKNQMLVIESRQRVTVKDLDTQLRLLWTTSENSKEYLLGKDAPVLDPKVGVKLPKASSSTLYYPATAPAETHRASTVYTQGSSSTVQEPPRLILPAETWESQPSRAKETRRPT